MAKRNWRYIDVARLDFDDKKTWALICSGLTDGVFQLESSGMKDVCMRLQPDNMEILIAILALYRPDTMSELEHYIKRRNGEEDVKYLHKDIIPILEKTYGCILYQEQIMAITKVFAGFSNAEADKFRKGIGKKKKALVEEQAEKFRGRALEKGYSKEVVDALTEHLKAMGGYSFNKGHATGYAITSYKTAYLKANYPVEFMCSLLSNQKKEKGSTDYESISYYLLQCNQMGIKVSNPNINTSQVRFSVVDNTILYGLELIKGVGKNAVRTLMGLRPFNSFEDYLERTEQYSEIDKTITLALIKAGAFDFTGKSRESLLLQFGDYRFKNKLDDIKPIKNINKTHIEKLIEAGLIQTKHTTDRELCLDVWNSWRKQLHREDWENNCMAGNEFNWEYESISYHLLGNPFEGVELPSWDEYDNGDSNVKVGGTIISVKKTKIKKGKNVGKTMAFISLDTTDGIREVTVFNQDWDKFQDTLEKGAMVIIRGIKQDDKMVLNGIKTLEKFRETEM
jgi:DNA polymerase-3 subunit alpha